MKSGALTGSILLLAASLSSQAASVAYGSWSSFSVGGTVSVGNQPLSSRPLAPLLPPAAAINRVAWRITLLSPAPPALTIKLCSQDKCIYLESLAGQKNVGALLPAHGPFHFVYTVNHQGQLIPPLNVVKNQLTIDWKIPAP